MARKRADNTNKPLHKRQYHLPLPSTKLGDKLSTPVNSTTIKRTKVGGFFHRTKLISYVRNSRIEMKKVTWPTRKESMRLTFAVFVFTAVFAGFTTLVDKGFEQVVEKLFL